MADFTIKKGALLPPLIAVLKDGTGAVVDLTTATTVKFSMASVPGGTRKVNAAAVTVVDAPNGKVSYQWAGTDTDTPGNYAGEFLVNFPSQPEVFPSDGYLGVLVEQNV